MTGSSVTNCYMVAGKDRQEPLVTINPLSAPGIKLHNLFITDINHPIARGYRAYKQAERHTRRVYRWVKAKAG